MKLSQLIKENDRPINDEEYIMLASAGLAEVYTDISYSFFETLINREYISVTGGESTVFQRNWFASRGVDVDCKPTYNELMRLIMIRTFEEGIDTRFVQFMNRIRTADL